MILPAFRTMHIYLNDKKAPIYSQICSYEACDEFLEIPIDVCLNTRFHQIARTFCFFGWVYVYKIIFHEVWI